MRMRNFDVIFGIQFKDIESSITVYILKQGLMYAFELRA